jgi:hypothetical protein
MLSNNEYYHIFKFCDQPTLRSLHQIHQFSHFITSNYKLRFHYLYEDDLLSLPRILQCNKMAEYGDLNCLKYAKKLGYKLSEHTAVIAIKFGHLNCLKYLCENDCSIDTTLMLLTAINFGQLDCLEYLCDICSDFSWIIFNDVTRSGHLNILKFLHQKQILTFNESIFINAARYGHLHCLKYAVENNCPTSVFAYAYAIKNGHIDCVKYLYDIGIFCNVIRENIHPNCKSFIIKKNIIRKFKNLFNFLKI